MYNDFSFFAEGLILASTRMLESIKTLLQTGINRYLNALTKIGTLVHKDLHGQF